MITLPRMIFGGLVAALLFIVTCWTFDVNIGAWVGAWFAPDSMYVSGFGIITVLSLASGWVYHLTVGTKFGGPGAVRGLLFGGALGLLVLFLVPPALNLVANAMGATKIVYQGADPTTVRDLQNERPDGTLVSGELQQETKHVQVPPCPDIQGVKPPFRSVTQEHPWVASDAWRGRLIPWGTAFLVLGLIFGLTLSEKKDE